MQNLIKEIVDMDRKAREITDAAQLEKVNSEKEVTEKREQIRAEYLERARKRIAMNEPQERAIAEEGWKKIQAKNEDRAKHLDDLYREKGDEWVNTLAARVIGE
ncbi:hypothetical protein [Anaeromassilibacillus senegalensis]|uniref:hypothetical protein n=1 Tax=Anaeromassilibacillus senegalensis TaxID=1673717 RepID=UPI00068046DB|nr:hypothetical protein [Anaeromassilibacillus senegalensis]